MSKTQEAQTGSQDMVAKLLAQSKSGSHSEAWPDLRWWDHGSPSGWEELALPLVKAVLGARFTDCLLCAQHCTGLRRRVASEEEEDLVLYLLESSVGVGGTAGEQGFAGLWCCHQGSVLWKQRCSGGGRIALEAVGCKRRKNLSFPGVPGNRKVGVPNGSVRSWGAWQS